MLTCSSSCTSAPGHSLTNTCLTVFKLCADSQNHMTAYHTLVFGYCTTVYTVQHLNCGFDTYRAYTFTHTLHSPSISAGQPRRNCHHPKMSEILPYFYECFPGSTAHILAGHPLFPFLAVATPLKKDT